MKFLFDFRVPENLDRLLLTLCELNLPSVRFSGLHNGMILRTSLQRKKFTAICCALHKNELHTSILNSGYLLSGTCRQKLSFFYPDFLAFRSVLFLQQTSLSQTVSELGSHHRYINIEWIYKECKAWF